LIFSVGLRATALSAIASPSAGFAALAASAILSRGLLPAMMHLLPLASVTGLAASAGKPNRRPVLVSAGLTCAGAILFLGPALGIGGIIFGSLVVASLALVARRLIGGYNGDTLGAAQQSADVAVLIFIAAAG
jgi:adenosylcobinamide-GDP ribazoletransferase